MIHCFYISLFILHFSAGCILLDKQQVKEVTGYTGGSVLLPCSCADPQSTVKTFKWIAQPNGNQWIDALTNKKYRGRLVLFNENSAGNLSLLISGLRMEDEGHYMCMTESNSYTDVWLTVKEKPHELVNTQEPDDKMTKDEIAPHHTSQYGFVLIPVFAAVLILVFLVFNSWGCRGNKKVKVTSDGELELENKDGYSTVNYINQHPHQLP